MWIWMLPLKPTFTTINKKNYKIKILEFKKTREWKGGTKKKVGIKLVYPSY